LPLLGRIGNGLNSGPVVTGISGTNSGVRHASKKASGGKRNPEGAPGKNRGLKVFDGHRIIKTNVIATQLRPNWLPGRNVEMLSRLKLHALKTGRLVMTCETPDLDMNHPINQKFYAGREGQTFFKKYIHIIPDPQHVRFKLIAQV